MSNRESMPLSYGLEPARLLVDRHVTSQALRAAVVPVQSDPSYRAAAERVRKSIQAGGGGPELIEQSLGLRA